MLANVKHPKMPKNMNLAISRKKRDTMMTTRNASKRPVRQTKNERPTKLSSRGNRESLLIRRLRHFLLSNFGTKPTLLYTTLLLSA